MANQHIVPNIAPAPQKALLCPSAQPDMEGVRVLGVISGSAEQSQVAYLNSNVPVPPGFWPRPPR